MINCSDCFWCSTVSILISLCNHDFEEVDGSEAMICKNFKPKSNE